MYFNAFPQTLYSNDDRKTVKVVTNILLRTVITEQLKQNFASYDEYDVRDGDTPEILAFKLYGDSNLHWIILLFNDILDPTFDWPLESSKLYSFVEGKYNDVQGIHHYINVTRNEVNAEMSITSLNDLNNFNVGEAMINATNNGTAVITNKFNNNHIVIKTTKGGFKSQDQITLASNANIVANINMVSNVTATPITNLVFETVENENKRRIKILKPRFVQKVIDEFELRLSQVNG